MNNDMNPMNNQVPNNNVGMNNVNTQPPVNNGVVNPNPVVDNNVPNTSFNPTPQVAPNAPKGGNNKIIIIIVALVAVVAIILGVVLMTNNGDEKEGSSNSGTTEQGNNNGGGSETGKETGDKTTLKLFSEYENYTFTMDADMEIASGNSVIAATSKSDGKADVKNGTDYMVTKVDMFGTTTTTYSYNDLESGYTYSSNDNVNWTSEKIASGADETIELEEIITKINGNDPSVTKNSDGSYNVDITSGGVQGIKALVKTNSEGWVTSVSYDLSSILKADGFNKYYVVMNLSKFNETGDVVIPNEVLGATSASI